MELKDIIVQNLNRIIAMRGTNNRAVADAAGLSHTVVRDIVSRKTGSPTVSTLERIAKVLNVTLGELLGIEEMSGQGIEVIGRVVAKARIAKFDGSHNNVPYQVRRPQHLKSANLCAVVVEGDCMDPMYQSGHILFFSQLDTNLILREDIGKPCVVSDARGDLSLKLLRTGNSPDRWHLIGLAQTSETSWDADVAKASRILFTLPADFVETAP